ncbi:MAG: hypothetical protein NT018_04885 [Armatimonadetes bacterium]|nr:hypothetical protein [Armatimonadota bacterium]
MIWTIFVILLVVAVIVAVGELLTGRKDYMSVIAGLVFGLLLLTADLYGWQHYQPQIDTNNSMLGQLAIGVGGKAAAREAETIRVYYIGSIVSAFLGAIMVLGCSIALAVRKR